MKYTNQAPDTISISSFWVPTCFLLVVALSGCFVGKEKLPPGQGIATPVRFGDFEVRYSSAEYGLTLKQPYQPAVHPPEKDHVFLLLRLEVIGEIQDVRKTTLFDLTAISLVDKDMKVYNARNSVYMAGNKIIEYEFSVPAVETDLYLRWNSERLIWLGEVIPPDVVPNYFLPTLY